MTLEDIVKFVKNTPHTVIANHMEAVNHCPSTREILRTELTKQGLTHKTRLPADGETMVF